MELSQMVAARVEYRCVLVLPDSLDVFAFAEAGHHRLPRIHIARSRVRYRRYRGRSRQSGGLMSMFWSTGGQSMETRPALSQK